MPELPNQPNKGQSVAEAPHKPFTVPPGYVPPTLKEQWLYVRGLNVFQPCSEVSSSCFDYCCDGHCRQTEPTHTGELDWTVGYSCSTCVAKGL